jgi:hypothetical protein
MTVTIPSCEQHEGIFLMTVTISDYCPKCGKKRGIDTIHKGFSYDGSRRLVVDCWENPCGHVDKYSEIREEVKGTLEFITSHITDLEESDCGALQVWNDNGRNVVDLEWCDGVSAFDLEKVLNLIHEKGSVTKAELCDECL